MLSTDKERQFLEIFCRCLIPLGTISDISQLEYRTSAVLDFMSTVEVVWRTVDILVSLLLLHILYYTYTVLYMKIKNVYSHLVLEAGLVVAAVSVK